MDQSLLVNRVVDMDWRFGVTAASSELAQAGSTFLQLKLVVAITHFPDTPPDFHRQRVVLIVALIFVRFQH